MNIQHQRGFGFGIVGHKQAPGFAVFRQVKQQRRLLAQWLPAFFDSVVFRVDDQNFTAAVRGVQTLGLFRVMQAGHPFAGVFDPRF
ncbi:hypothetical protein D3C85_1701950 [compost metagenome]